VVRNFLLWKKEAKNTTKNLSSETEKRRGKRKKTPDLTKRGNSNVL